MTTNQTAEQSTPVDGQRGFAAWFAKNYPRDTLLYDPHWHAPKIYRAAIAASEMREAYLNMSDARSKWQGEVEEFVDVTPLSVSAFMDGYEAGLKAAAASQYAEKIDDKTDISHHNLSTSEGGRGYVAEFFAKRLRRHDFRRYIAESLAADFACALAEYLREHDSVARHTLRRRPEAQ